MILRVFSSFYGRKIMKEERERAKLKGYSGLAKEKTACAFALRNRTLQAPCPTVQLRAF